MSAIDNAFVRAYRRKSEPTQPAAEPAIVPAPNQLTNLVATATQQQTVRILSQQSDHVSVIPAPHIRLAAFTQVATTLDTVPASHTSQSTPPTTKTIRIDPPAVIARAPVEIEPAGEAPAPRQSLPIRENRSDGTARLAPLASHPNPIAEEEGTGGTPSIQAAYEVDRFEWPTICDAWTARSADDIDRLARELLAEVALDRRVIAISGCRRGEGRTTLALVLARRLAAGGAKVAIVDAHIDAPDLAERLSLSIDGGWERVADDGKSVAAAMIESLEDRLTVLPLAPQAAARITDSNQLAIRLSGCLAQMRKNFDVILIDAGPLVTGTTICEQLFALGSPIEAAILVSDSRTASREQLAKINRRLIDANIAPLGVAENYCSVYSSRSA